MKKLALYIFLFTGLGAHTQTGNLVFNDTVLHTLTIQASTDWFNILENDYKQNFTDPTTYPQVYRNCAVTWDGIALNNCGFREKGFSSNNFTNFGKKKPFKIAFDAFSNQSLNGLKKINLNNFTNDPSLLHDVIADKLFRDEGLVAIRTSFTKLWINGEYIGLYLVIEDVDKTFLKYHYGSANNDGNLYKTNRGAQVNLNWLGSASDGYKTQGLKLTTNDSIDDWSKLTSFIDFLNNDHSANFKQTLETRFDVHAYLKVLAIEKCIRSWDSYWGNGNNFYLYEHPDGKIRWIPWDENESFQALKVLSGTSFFDGYLIPTPQFDKRPLLNRIFEIDEWKNEYLDNVCDLVKTKFTTNNLGKYILDRHDLVDSAYAADVYKYNSYTTFQKSLTEDNEDDVSFTHSAYVIRVHYPGLFPFIQSQREWAAEQMKAWDHTCNIKDNSTYDLIIYPNPAATEVKIPNDVNSFDYAQFKIFDFTGKICRNTDFVLMQGNYFTLDLQGLPAGIYLLLKQSSDGRIGKTRLLKMH